MNLVAGKSEYLFSRQLNRRSYRFRTSHHFLHRGQPVAVGLQVPLFEVGFLDLLIDAKVSPTDVHLDSGLLDLLQYLLVAGLDTNTEANTSRASHQLKQLIIEIDRNQSYVRFPGDFPGGLGDLGKESHNGVTAGK